MKSTILLLIYAIVISHGNIGAETKHPVFSPRLSENYINLKITGLKGSSGLVRIGIFASDKGYPDQPDLSYSLAKDTLINGQLKLVIPVKGPCELSISILDDENGNGIMDYKFGIIPKEGFGFSNNPKVTSRKAPPFSETSFRFKGGVIMKEINMVYM